MYEELVAIHAAIEKLATPDSKAPNPHQEKDQFLQENVAASSTTSQIASVMMAVIVFLFSVPSIIGVREPYFETLVSFVCVAEIAFVTAVTYFMRGSNP